MILVTGATGTVGREVTRRLAARHPLRILARRPDRVTVQGPDVEIVGGDYADRPALVKALTGVRAVFVVTNNPQRPEDDADLVAAAQLAGVRRLVKLSAYAVADPQADDLITRWQRGNEELITASGLDWTFLRPRAFMTNTLSWASSVRAEGVVRALNASTARTACIDPDDIAAVAVRALTEPGHAGRVYALTGPEALTVAEQTSQLSAALGRPLRAEELTVDQARAGLRRRYPEPLVAALLESAERALDGGKAVVTPTVAEVTGRPAGRFRSWATRNAAAFS